MQSSLIPLQVIGPGSQPADEVVLEYIEMPRGMDTFGMPRVPEQADPRAMRTARDLMAGFLGLLGGWKPGSRTPGPRRELRGMAPAALRILNQVLGEGEVSIRVAGGRDLRIQESVFAGIWRVSEIAPDGALLADWIEAGPVPRVVDDEAAAVAAPDFSSFAAPAGAMNSPALLGEIAAQCRGWHPGRAPHVINLSLLPMTPEDHGALALALPVGAVTMLSRGFGNCRISSTTARHVWRVQYFNNARTLILDSIEVVGMPEVAVAAADDLEDSRGRLAELVEWMGEELEG